MDDKFHSQRAAALRDFFVSINAKELREAASNIAHCFNLPLNE